MADTVTIGADHYNGLLAARERVQAAERATAEAAQADRTARLAAEQRTRDAEAEFAVELAKRNRAEALTRIEKIAAEAGMLDPRDVASFVDESVLTPESVATEGQRAIDRLRASRPYLFCEPAASTSEQPAALAAPVITPSEPQSALDMTDAEFAAHMKANFPGVKVDVATRRSAMGVKNRPAPANALDMNDAEFHKHMREHFPGVHL